MEAIGFVILILSFAIYFLPTIIAYNRKPVHKNAMAVLLLNFFLGWTLIGWVAALIWSVMNTGDK